MGFVGGLRGYVRYGSHFTVNSALSGSRECAFFKTYLAMQKLFGMGDVVWMVLDRQADGAVSSHGLALPNRNLIPHVT